MSLSREAAQPQPPGSGGDGGRIVAVEKREEVWSLLYFLCVVLLVFFLSYRGQDLPLAFGIS